VSYAVIETGGKQFRVTRGQIIKVPVLDAESGASVEFNTLMTIDGADIAIGSPALDGVRVRAKVLDRGRGPKVIVFKKKRKKQYKKTIGHRQDFTSVLIESISGEADFSSEAPAAKAEKPSAALSAPETTHAAPVESGSEDADATASPEGDAADVDAGDERGNG